MRRYIQQGFSLIDDLMSIIQENDPMADIYHVSDGIYIKSTFTKICNIQIKTKGKTLAFQSTNPSFIFNMLSIFIKKNNN